MSSNVSSLYDRLAERWLLPEDNGLVEAQDVLKVVLEFEERFMVMPMHDEASRALCTSAGQQDALDPAQQLTMGNR